MNDSAPQLWVNASLRKVSHADVNCSLLQYLREDLGLKGTKEGCASGDCGACTVVIAGCDGGQAQTVNSCITPLGAVIGRQVLTVEGVGQPGSLHPVQQAMVDEHGSQCGFCTPGFVMSLVGQQLQCADTAALTALERDDLVRSISGNLCRCTGYRPILAAAQRANEHVARTEPKALLPHRDKLGSKLLGRYLRPQTEVELQSLLPTGYPLVAGSTDLWLEVTQRYRDFAGLIDVSAIDSMRTIEQRGNRLQIGAAVTLTQLLEYFSDGSHASPAVVTLLHRFGSPQIRGRATLGGNVANASPIADWPPLLLVLDANVLLTNARGETRSLPLAEFYLGYKKTALAAYEYIAAIDIDADADFEGLRAYKISKREDDDISSTMGAFSVSVRDGAIDRIRIAFGGVAATPVRLVDVEERLQGKPLNEATIALGTYALTRALDPISDVRASRGYRLAVSAQLLRKGLLAHVPEERFEAHTLTELLDQ